MPNQYAKAQTQTITSTGTTRSTARLMAAAALALTPMVIHASALAQVAGKPQGVSQAAPVAAEPSAAVAGPIAEAAALTKSGKLVQAKNVLEKLVSAPEWEKTSVTDQDAVSKALKGVEKKIKAADPYDVSLQKATVSMQEGNLQLAEQHIKAIVARDSKADSSQKNTARETLSALQARRNELLPVARQAISQAASDFEAGRYEASKSALAGVRRTGAELTAEESSRVERYQLKILELERINGRPFAAEPANLGAWQPGVVRRDEPGATPPSTPNNEAAPAVTIPVVAQPATPAPAPAAAPAAQPTVQPAPQPAAPGDDLIRQAMKADGARVIAEGDEKFAEGRPNLALEKYLLASSGYRQYLTQEQISYVESRIAECRVRMNTGSPADQFGANANIALQRAKAEFDLAMEQADKALKGGDAQQAVGQTAQARLSISKVRQLMSEAQFSELNAQIDEKNRQIEQKRSEIDAAERATQAQMRAKDAATAEGVRRSEKDRKINENIDRARALQMEQKYEEALQVVDNILFLDPINPSGMILRDALQGIILYRKSDSLRRERAYRGAYLQLDVAEDMLPPKGMMDYPMEWPKKSFDRGELSAYYETPENRRVLTNLENSKTSVDFKDNSLADVVAFLNQVAGVDIDADWNSLSSVGVKEDSTVNLKLNNVPIRVVLDRVMQKVSTDQFAKAGWAVEEGGLRIASEDELRKNTTLVIYDISDLLFQPGTYDQVPQIDLQSLLQQSQGGGGGGGQSPFTDDQQQQQGGQQNRMRLAQLRAERIALIREIITGNVDPEGWKDGGGDTGVISELNSTLIIRNTPRNHREIVGLLSKLREVRSMQINVETKFLLVNQSWFEQIGFDIDVVINGANNQVRSARQNNAAVQPRDFFNFGNASPGSNRGLQRTIGGAVDLNGDGDNTDPGETTGAINTVPPRGFSPVAGFQDSLGLAQTLVEGDFASQVAGANPALGIAGQFLDDVQVDFLIQATQADKRTVQLTAPRLTFTNGQIANIFVVTQQAFVSDLTPVVGDSAVGFDPTVAVASEGVTMLMEGVIAADRKYVTLNVDAGVGRIDGFAQQPVTAVAGGQLVNSADTQSFIQLPTITVTRVRTTVTVPDEGTVLLGGQRLITELEIETGVPVLSKIPILNRFFTNRISSKEEQTLLILLKPTILIQSEQEEKHFPGLADQLQTGLR